MAGISRHFPHILAVCAVLSASAALAGGQVVIRAEDCSAFVPHVAAGDVHYRPEADAARGIVPADLPSSGAAAWREELDYLARNFEFAVWRDLQMGRRGPRATGIDAVIAYVEVRDGYPYVNGLPLSGDDLNAAMSACRKSADDADQKDADQTGGGQKDR